MSEKGQNGLPRISRRESLKWFGMVLAGNALTPYPADAAVPAAAGDDNWPMLKLAPVTAPGYGQDPDLVSMTAGPWPRTLSADELDIVRLVAGIVVPREGDVPSAAELHVEDVVDEWVSAPYEAQQRDRVPVVSLLIWLDAESERRFGHPFAAADDAQRTAIVDDIAWLDTQEIHRRPAQAFDRLRSIIVAAFFCTPEGSADLGYLGGQPIAGDYPGPTAEARRHLAGVLESLGLDAWVDPAAG